MSDECALRLLVSGPEGAREMTFEQEEVLFGRDPECDVVLRAPYVSRRHAILTSIENELILIDQESKNGVIVNGTRIAESRCVQVGDIISIGAFRITLLRPEEVEPTTQDLISWQQSISIERASRRVQVGENEIEEPLSVMEFDLLWLLFERAESVVTRDELGAAIWGIGNFDPNMVHRLVRRVRLKIEPDPTAPRFLRAIPGVGYVLRHTGLSG